MIVTRARPYKVSRQAIKPFPRFARARSKGSSALAEPSPKASAIAGDAPAIAFRKLVTSPLAQPPRPSRDTTPKHADGHSSGLEL
jgi:hypothetical protein